MTGLIGADVEDLERLAAQLRHAADRFEAIRGQITATYGRTHWEGDDADHCRNEWYYRLSPHLHAAATAGRGAATVLDRNVVEQRAASGVGDALGGAVGGGIGGMLAMWPGMRLDDGHGDGHGDDHGEHHHSPWHYIHLAAEATMIPIEILHASGVLKVGEGLLHGVNGGLAIAGLVIYGPEFIQGLINDPSAPTTYQAGINTVLSAAALATVGFPPASLAIGVVAVAYNIAEEIWPGVGKAAIEGAAHGVSVAAEWVVDTGSDVWEAGVEVVGDVVEDVGDLVEVGIGAIGDAGEAVGNVISGGVDAFVSIFD